MNLSRKWLNEFVTVEANDKDFAEAMTLSGSKVEVTEDLGAEIVNVVVGKVLSLERHPDSDHMWVCKICVGNPDEPIQIVTGAWNVHVGDMVPVAKHKSVLPGGKKIEKGKLRGVESNGMLCGLSELGLDERDFPYAVISAAAILGDYKAIDPEKPSIPADIAAGDKIYGPVVAAKVTAVENAGVNLWKITLDGKTEVITPCQNLHEGDLVAYNTKTNTICTLADLHAEQREFPHCIPDGIFILHEDGIACGDDIKPIIGADDSVVEFEITPNRPDCLSVIGLAREAAATFNAELRLHEPVVKGGADGNLMELLDVETPAEDLCPRYTARMVRNVKIAPSPKWMRERLRAMGVRPINNIVDITNYVMLEYGQPMHAFDYRYVKGGKIIVRRAEEGEELTTLDGNVRKLTRDHLVIADDTRAVGLAGIMGGLNSEIVEDTVDVVFESANFNGTCIRKGALALGMRTEASAKFEKGLDILNTLPAVNRACELVELLGAGEVVDGVIDILNYVPQPTTLTLEPEKINDLLGTDVPADEMVRILKSVGFTVDGDQVGVPSWRGDVLRMADLAEEVARFYGYNNIPCTLVSGETTRGGYSPAQKLEQLLGSVCRTCGCDEIITYSFISPTYYDKIRWAENDPRRESFKILNPLGEDTSIMRTTVLPSMLEILTRNYNYRNKAARLYEIGRTYAMGGEDGLAVESKVLSLGIYGADCDFFTLKGIVEAALSEIRAADVRFAPCSDNPSYHPGRCATVWSGDTCIGVFGQIHPLVAQNYGVDAEFYCAELSFDALFAVRGADPVYQPLPKFPAVTRDIAVVCDKTITVGALEDCIRRGAKGLLKDVSLFDIYTGTGIPEGKKSVAFNLTLRADDRSLTAEEADADVKSILALLESELNATLR
ncbi:MAG: phenylalanine--tRNA ligase subunit beta [Ruminococcaceae bacterium]|nr:phenylalanine--tRNA ligase subunit beta [Oscillospiraceae bacterium]